MTPRATLLLGWLDSAHTPPALASTARAVVLGTRAVAAARASVPARDVDWSFARDTATRGG